MMELQSLKGKVVNGVLWNAIQLVVNKGFGFVIKLVLARLLFPDQFGLVGMAVVFTGFVQVFNDLGIGAALVQRKAENLKEAHFHTAFWTGVAWSIGVYIVIAFLVAPFAASFYGEPMLRQIIPVLSIGVLSSPINLVHNAQLTREMNFKKLAVISNLSTIFSGVVALVLAFMGAGVWSLVFNSVATFLIAMPLYFRATGWIPKLIWEKEAFKDVFGFGVFTTGTGLFNALITNIDYLLIGKLLSAAALGTYTLAFVLTDTFRNQLMLMMGKVMYPVYGQKQDDILTIKRYYLKVVKYNSICIYPVMIFYVILGEPFMLDFFGQKWSEAILPLKLLALSVMVHLLVNSHASLIRGLGKPRLEMKIQLVKALVFYIPLIYAGIHYYGIAGAAGAYVLNKVIEVFIAQYYLKKLIHISFKELMFHMKAPLLASAVAFAVTYFLYSLGLHYLLSAVALAISYGITIWLLMKAEINVQLKEIKKFREKKMVAL